MRVGERTDYNKLRIFIKTDGSITPSKALHKSANILKDHIEKVALVEVKEAEPEKTSSTGKKRKKAVKGKEEKKKKKK